jgi:hypothetical protein
MVQQIKPLLRRKAPRIYRAISRMRAYGQFALHSPRARFDRIYRTNRWGSAVTFSGTGSDLAQTAEIRRQLPSLITELQCRTLLDVPCGDYYWMSHVELDVDQYFGADIVSALVDANQAGFGDDEHTFVVLDLMGDELPRADIVFCRDCLVHLSYVDASSALRNIRSSGATYLLTTTFTGRDRNHDITTGTWRPINLELPPFDFPAPMRLVDEGCTEADGQFADKQLGLWRVADLPLRERETGTSDLRGVSAS